MRDGERRERRRLLEPSRQDFNALGWFSGCSIQNIPAPRYLVNYLKETSLVLLSRNVFSLLWKHCFAHNSEVGYERERIIIILTHRQKIRNTFLESRRVVEDLDTEWLFSRRFAMMMMMIIIIIPSLIEPFNDLRKDNMRSSIPRQKISHVIVAWKKKESQISCSYRLHTRLDAETRTVCVKTIYRKDPAVVSKVSWTRDSRICFCHMFEADETCEKSRKKTCFNI